MFEIKTQKTPSSIWSVFQNLITRILIKSCFCRIHEVGPISAAFDWRQGKPRREVCTWACWSCVCFWCHQRRRKNHRWNTDRPRQNIITGHNTARQDFKLKIMQAKHETKNYSGNALHIQRKSEASIHDHDQSPKTNHRFAPHTSGSNASLPCFEKRPPVSTSSCAVPSHL